MPLWCLRLYGASCRSLASTGREFAPAGDLLSCSATRKKAKKCTLLAAPSGFLRCEYSRRPALRTRFAQTARPDIPAVSALRSAAQKGWANKTRSVHSRQLVVRADHQAPISLWLAEWRVVSLGKSGPAVRAKRVQDRPVKPPGTREPAQPARRPGAFLCFLSCRAARKEVARRGETRPVEACRPRLPQNNHHRSAKRMQPERPLNGACF